MVKRLSLLESHVGIEPASKLANLSKEGIYDVTHPIERWERLEKEENEKKKERLKKRFKVNRS